MSFEMKESARATSGLRQIGLVAVFALTALGASTTAQAQQSAMRMAKDPVTGQLRAPTAAENAELDALALTQKAAQLKRRVREAGAAPAEVTYPDGTVEMKMDEESYMYTVAVRNDDGTITMQCLPGKEAKAVSLGKKKTVAAKKGA